MKELNRPKTFISQKSEWNWLEETVARLYKENLELKKQIELVEKINKLQLKNECQDFLNITKSQSC